MKVSTARELSTILMLGGIILILCREIYMPFLIIGSIITLFGLVVRFLYNKCPYCKRQLGREDGEYCPHCGRALD
jgi:predicted amidophosphoribosyltransferase